MKHGVYRITVEGQAFWEVYCLCAYEGQFATLADAEKCFSKLTSELSYDSY